VARIGLPAERMDDSALLAGLQSGEPEVGLAFVRRFQRQVFGVALAVVGDPTTAEEVAQQAFERAWSQAGRFDADRGSVRAWLSTITRNLAIDVVRSRRPSPTDPADMVRLLGDAGDDPEKAALHAEEVAELRAAIRGLPPEQARAIVMAGIYGMTAEQVAGVEGVPLGTAKTRIRTALIKLRNTLAERGVTRG
jgi:RNA polymerase sigma factor (sigma-70 family)